MSVKFTVRRNVLPQLINTLEPELVNVVTGTALSIEGLTKKNIVDKNIIDTGNMLNSVNADQVEDGGLTRFVGPHTDYAIYNEMGTYKMAARPFLQPAVEQARPVFLRNLQRVLKRWADQ